MRYKKRIKSFLPLLFATVLDRIEIFIFLFVRRHPLSSKKQSTTPFFIIGSGRSGNTLLRSMLVSGLEVAIPPESYVWPRVLRKFTSYNFLPWNSLSSLVISEFEAYPEFYTWKTDLTSLHKETRTFEKEEQSLANILDSIYRTYSLNANNQELRWGDKTPINTIYIDKIAKIFPKAQYIHIIRDPRDSVASYLKAELNKSLQDAIEIWNLSNQKALKLKRQFPNQYVMVKYEQLVSEPETELHRLCNFLSIQFKPGMLDFYKNTSILGDVSVHKHHANINNPINKESIGRWKSVLNTKDSEYIWNECEDLALKLGYVK